MSVAPWPSSVYELADATSATGVRLAGLTLRNATYGVLADQGASASSIGGEALAQVAKEAYDARVTEEFRKFYDEKKRAPTDAERLAITSKLMQSVVTESHWYGDKKKPAFLVPEVKPEQPKPTPRASTTTTRTPFSARCSAEERPV